MAARRPGLERSKTGSASHRVSQAMPVVQVAQASRPREAAGPKISPVINPLLSAASCAAYTPS